MTAAAKIALVHLVRKANGIDPFKVFLKSYKDNPAGIPHDLIIIFKGFKNKNNQEYGDLLQGIPHKSCFVVDIGFDIGPYFHAVRNFEYKYFVFLNSFCVILSPDWLAKMYGQLIKPNVGAVGATGSWESAYTSALNLQVHRTFYRKFARRANQLFLKRRFPPFPNYHLRTNAFMASRELLLKIKVPLILTKQDALRFESGVKGFTCQILEMNQRTLVIGRDGQPYEKENWLSSGTFRQGEQNNLLIADNKTNSYQLSDYDVRRYLSAAAWGSRS